MSENQQAIWAALAAVQMHLKTQAHTRRVDVGKYGYTYTELSALCDYLLPVLGAAGIATTYTTRLAPPDALEIECRLTAGDGSSVAASTFITPASWTAQDVGKSMTYGRRYTLQMVTGIATEADDDCAPDSAKHAPKEAPKAATPPATPPSRERDQLEGTGITEAQRRKVFARVKEIMPADATDDDVRAACTKTAQDMFQLTVSGLNKKQASTVIEWLETATFEMLTDKVPF